MLVSKLCNFIKVTLLTLLCLGPNKMMLKNLESNEHIFHNTETSLACKHTQKQPPSWCTI